MARKANFIDAFMAYTEGRGSPEMFRKATAISIVSAAMERKTWVTTAKGRLFPNQYILLVGPPGVGKSLCTTTAYDLLNEIRSPETPFHLAPTSVSKASMIDRLVEAERRIVRPMETPAIMSFNSLTIIANEFGVFLPSWEGEFMNTMTDLWDCGRYAEKKRTSKLDIELPNTQLSLLSATTPAHLNQLLPEGAWETGFMSRILIIYSGEFFHTDLFSAAVFEDKSREGLVNDLRDIYKIYGEFTVTDDAKEALNEWSKKGGPPVPEHPKLMHYRSRRIAHLLKLCMVASAASDSDRIITLDHYAEALDWLISFETFMPDVFKSLKTSGDARAIEECYHFVYQLWIKHKEPIVERRIINFLQERVPVHNIDRILDVMVRAHLLEKEGKGYVPKTREP